MHDVIDDLISHDARAELAALGYVIVPREPTPEMKKAGENEVVCHSWSNDGEHIDAQSASDVYKAMIATWEKEKGA